MKIVNLILVVIFLVSCGSGRMLDGKSKMTSFRFEDSFIQNTYLNFPLIGYSDLLGISNGAIDLKSVNNIVRIPIRRHSVFTGDGVWYVKGGDNIKVRYDTQKYFKNYEFTIDKKKDNDRLNFLNKFISKDTFSFKPILDDNTIQSILDVEKKIFKRIDSVELYVSKLFDSTIKSVKIKSQDKQYLKSYLLSRSSGRILYYLNSKKDTLIAYNLYVTKLKGYLDEYNNFNKLNTFDDSKKYKVNLVANGLMKTPFEKMTSQIDFINNYDTINTYFKNLSQYFLTTKLFYTALKKEIKIPDSCLSNFYRNNKYPEYKKIIKNLLREKKYLIENTSYSGNQLLVPLHNNKVIDFDKIVKDNIGKVLIIDFWASWCVPCIKEIKYLEKIKQEFKLRNVVFISLSLDVESQRWKKASYQYDIILNSYRVVDNSKFLFSNIYKIDQIPHFVIIGINGEIINDNAPYPSTGLLNQHIDLYLKKINN